MGDHLLLKRIEANLSQPEVAKNVGVSTRTVRKWEHGHVCPTEDHWQALAHFLCLDCQVVHLLCESMGIRAIQRITGLHQETILNILETAGQKAAAYLDAKIRNVTADAIQADEIHSFVFSKQRNTDANDLERGDQFTFLSVDHRSKLIVNWLVGKRTAENADQFLGDLKARVTSRIQLTTDNWKVYSGFVGSVRRVFGNDVNYATEMKYFGKRENFLPLRLIGIRRHRCIGNPNMDIATTCHAERTNGPAPRRGCSGISVPKIDSSLLWRRKPAIDA